MKSIGKGVKNSHFKSCVAKRVSYVIAKLSL